MITLSESHANVWKDSIPKLIYVVSSVVKNNDFDDKTRENAMELMITIAEHRAPLLRKYKNEMKE